MIKTIVKVVVPRIGEKIYDGTLFPIKGYICRSKLILMNISYYTKRLVYLLQGNQGNLCKVVNIKMLKKFSLLFFTIIYLNNYIISQSLTVNETIKYISDQYIKNSQPEINRMNLHYGYKLINFRIDISEDGYIKIVTSKTHPSNPRINDEIKFHYNDVEIRIDDHNEIEIICNYSRKCISFSSSSPYMLGHIHACITEPKYVERISNAFKYLISILPNYPEYNINDGDPFSNLNFKKDISSTVSESILKIKLFESEGVFSLDALLGGIKRRVIFDSGASEVSISKEAEISLINASVISNDNYIQSGLFRTAGGNIISSRRFIIPYIKVGEFKVSNVICSVNPTDDLILLGRSFLNKFSKWSVDNEKKLLTLER